MKKITLILLFLISTNVFSQEKKRIFDPEFVMFILQCNNIGQSLIDKDKTVELENWYEGTDFEKIKSDIKQLKSDIENSDLEATYYLVMLDGEPLSYSFHFYNKETKTEFGLLKIRFEDRENNLVDEIKVINKAQLEKIKAEIMENPLPTGLPLPPPPPIEKKKNEN